MLVSKTAVLQVVNDVFRVFASLKKHIYSNLNNIRATRQGCPYIVYLKNPLSTASTENIPGPLMNISTNIVRYMSASSLVAKGSPE